MHEVVCRCDECNTEKREADHRFLVMATPNQFIVTDLKRSSPISMANQEHICGQECLHKRLSQWLEPTREGQ